MLPSSTINGGYCCDGEGDNLSLQDPTGGNKGNRAKPHNHRVNREPAHDAASVEPLLMDPSSSRCSAQPQPHLSIDVVSLPPPPPAVVRQGSLRELELVEQPQRTSFSTDSAQPQPHVSLDVVSPPPTPAVVLQCGLRDMEAQEQPQRTSSFTGSAQPQQHVSSDVISPSPPPPPAVVPQGGLRDMEALEQPQRTNSFTGSVQPQPHVSLDFISPPPPPPPPPAVVPRGSLRDLQPLEQPQPHPHVSLDVVSTPPPAVVRQCSLRDLESLEQPQDTSSFTAFAQAPPEPQPPVSIDVVSSTTSPAVGRDTIVRIVKDRNLDSLHQLGGVHRAQSVLEFAHNPHLQVHWIPLGDHHFSLSSKCQINFFFFFSTGGRS